MLFYCYDPIILMYQLYYLQTSSYMKDFGIYNSIINI